MSVRQLGAYVLDATRSSCVERDRKRYANFVFCDTYLLEFRWSEVLKEEVNVIQNPTILNKGIS
jgi:hypothetical protein